MGTMLLELPRAFVPGIDDDLTRRRLLSGIGVLGLTVTLPGCAEDADDAAALPALSPEPTPSTESAYPVRIRHKYGETAIASAPVRVVSVGFTDHDALLALGVVPVGVGGEQAAPLQRSGVFPWAHERLGGASPQVLSYLDPNIEAIAALAPDLITGFTSGMSEEQHRLLSGIAPTVAQLPGYPDYFAPWQAVARAAGAVTGRAGEAEALIAGIEERYARARLANPRFAGRSLAYAGVLDGSGFYTENSRSPRVALITALGFVVPAEIDALATDGGSYAELSAERLDLLDRDVLVWETPEAAARETVRSSPIYQRLAVAREGRDVFVDDEVLAAAMGYVSVLSVGTVLDLLVPRLAAALGDDVAATPAPS